MSLNVQSTSNIISLPIDAIAMARSFSTVRQAKPLDADLMKFGRLYGSSAAMQALYGQLQKVGPTPAPVLIVGESGTGKELAVLTIHEVSERSKGPLVAVNCSAFAPNLIEAELFGFERGSFTGAMRTHKGCFERAAGGTLFLDEITEMPMAMQTRLLRVLETGSVCRVGGERDIDIDVRIIAATNRDPVTAIAEGRLREDLWYRLAVFPVHMPALRDRDGDVVALARHFLALLNAGAGTSKRLSAATPGLLRRHNWPGNVRELKNVVQRAYILSDKELHVEVAGLDAGNASLHGGRANIAAGMTLAEGEKSLILATLKHHGGNKRQSAKTLGISLKTLYNRLNEYQMQSASVADLPPFLSQRRAV